MPLLGVLKIIAWILLGLVALALVLLLLLLFVPVRYRISGSFRQRTPDAEARLRWLGGVLGFCAAYHAEGGLQAYASVCGFKVYDLLADRSDTAPDEEDGIEVALDTAETAHLTGGVEEKDAAGERTGGQAVVSGDAAAGSRLQDARVEADGHGATAETDRDSRGQTAEHSSRTPAGAELREAAPAGASKRSDESGVNMTATAVPDTSLHERKEEWTFGSVRAKAAAHIRMSDSRVQTFAAQLRQRLSDLEERTDARIQAWIDRAKETFDTVKEAVSDKYGKGRALYALYTDAEYQDAIAMVKKRVMRLMKELRPRKGGGTIRYGADDPYRTGQAMQAAAFLYPLYGETIEVIPDFTDEILDAALDVRGRLHLVVPAEAALRIFFSKKLRKFYKKARQILENDR